MSETTNGIGKCLCGSVTLACDDMSLSVGACHCTSCQRWVGGPLLSVDCGPSVNIEGRENVSIYNSSDWAERAFCSACGSHLFYRLKHNNQHIVPVGLFGKQHDFNFDHQIFIEDKPEYYCFSNQTKNMTGAEVFAQAQS